MIVDRSHLRWGIGTAVASAAITVLYLANNNPELHPVHIPLPAAFGAVPPLVEDFGSTPLGLTYGTVALLIFLFAALLGWRRSHPSLKVGRIQAWLKAHIWLTILTLPLVVFHCGFQVGGPLTQFLLGLYALVMISGFWGLLLQNIVPKLMRDYLPEEVIFEEIPFIRSQIVAQAEAIRAQFAASADEAQLAAPGEAGTATLTVIQAHGLGSVVHFLDQDGLPYLKSRYSRRLRLRDKTVSDDLFRLLKVQVPEAAHPALDQLRGLCDEKRRIDFQTRLHYWLHAWLLVHAPASLLLVVLTFLHAIVDAYLYA
jgi:hypothetical protein